MNNASITYVKTKLNDRKAKKRFGQNFLIDANIAKKICSIASDKLTKTIEIGPGLGALTEYLINNSKSLDAYEIDRDLYEVLKNEFNNASIYNEDFLDTDLSIYKEPINIVSNLPYYVTTPILFKLFNSKLDIKKITVMVQKEVADRFTAKPKTKDYNALSVIVSYLYDVKYEFTVGASNFYPSPNVSSSVISFIPKEKRNYEYEEKLFKLIENSFRMRRKTLYNNLKGIVEDNLINKIFSSLNIKENIRAEELSLEDFQNIYKVIYEK